MVLQAELPKTLIASNFERYDSNRQGGRVPIQFVPEAEQATDEKKTHKSSTVKSKISATVKKRTHSSLLEVLRYSLTISKFTKRFWRIVK